MQRVRVGSVDELGEGQTLKFEFKREGITHEGFVARFQGKIVAYENVCRHLPLTLDYDDNRFFASDGKHFVCQTHGAVYEPLSGLCVRGPCEGVNLKPLKVVVEDGVMWFEP
ncbi:MAG: Rieske 2Fe-2S domain-containing protein, partial [Verrucomicrobiota bacterium]